MLPAAATPNAHARYHQHFRKERTLRNLELFPCFGSLGDLKRIHTLHICLEKVLKRFHLSLAFRANKEKTEKIVKKIPEKAKIGVYPMDWATNPAYNTEVNSAILIGM